MFGNKIIEVVRTASLIVGNLFFPSMLTSGANTNTIVPTGLTPKQPQTGLQGQVNTVGAGASNVAFTLYNTNIRDGSIILFSTQGNLTSNGPFLASMTTRPNGATHSAGFTIQRRLTATIAPSEHPTLNYFITN
jgi:hypothetical protein